MQSNSKSNSVIPPSVITMRTTVGRANSSNYNACYYFHAAGQPNENIPDFTNCVICTVSGEDGDKRVSKLVTTIHTQILKKIYLPFIEIPDSENREPISEELQTLYSQIDHENVSLTIAIFIGNIVYVSHVGDTRAYFVYNDGIEQITVDRSYRQQLIASQDMKQPSRNTLINVRKSLPMDHRVVDIYIRRRYSGSRFVLCTEGLPWLVTPDDIQKIVITNAPHEAAEKLVDLANERSATENITVIIA